MQAACRSPSPEPLSSNLLLRSTHLPPTLSARHPSSPSLWRRLRHHATVRERRPSTALLSRISPPPGSTTPFCVFPHLGLCWRSGTQYGAYPCMLNTGGPPLSRTATPIEYHHQLTKSQCSRLTLRSGISRIPAPANSLCLIATNLHHLFMRRHCFKVCLPRRIVAHLPGFISPPAHLALAA
jgi:hypothetical protein